MPIDIKNILKKNEQHKKKYQKDLDKMKNKALRINHSFFKKSISALFKKHKDLENFSWNQYTPNWNDGDECNFSANTSEVTINSGEELYSEWSVGNTLKKIKSKDKDKKINELEQKLISLSGSGKDNEYEIKSCKNELNELKQNVEQVEKLYEMVRDITDILDSFDNDLYQDMFGEGKIVVTKDGITTEHLDHD